MQFPNRLIRNRLLGISVCLAGVYLPIHNASAQDLGRVFYTPQQRIQLEQLQEGQLVPGRTTNEESTTVQNTIRYNGLVHRSGGRTTAWVNGQRLDQTADEFGDVNLYLRGSNLVVDGRNRRAIVGPGEEHQLSEDAIPESSTPAQSGADAN